MKEINIALLGFGTVGSGVAETLRMNGQMIADQLGGKLVIKHVLVRHTGKYRNHPLLQNVHVTDSFEDIINDDTIDIIVEVMGGIQPAKDYILAALRHKISVVSANKDLVSLYGPDIIQTAQENGVDFSCEASVGGGIPILMPLHKSLAGNEIERIIGIVNGTTNYILSNMTKQGLSYEAALTEAQRKGFAEADPTSDVCGYDAARKLAIMSSIGFRAKLTFDDVIVSGIESIASEDIRNAKDMGYVIKLLAVALRVENGVALNVYPAFVPENHPLASVNGSFNAIYVTGNAVGNVMFYGRGAGSLPTASAIMGDVITTARHLRDGTLGTDMFMTETRRIPFYSSMKLKDTYYFRLTVDDVSGVLAQIAFAFANYDISIKEVVQKSRQEKSAELILITDKAAREDIIHVTKALKVLPCMIKVANVIRVMDDETEEN